MPRQRDYAQYATIAALFLATSSLGGCKQGETRAEAPPLPVRVEAVSLASADETVRYAAALRPRIEADVAFRVGGKMVERLVDVGDRVEAGRPLARLDLADLELASRAAEAQLASARADAANAKRDFERYGQLIQGKWTTQQEFDKRRATMETTAAKVGELEAQLKVSRNSAQYGTLVADAPGVVTAVLAEPGQVVAQGQAVLRVARLGEIEAVANVPEGRIAGLARADLSVELWSAPGRSFPAKLREVSPIADPATRTYQVKLSLPERPQDARLGMTATVIARARQGGEIALLPMTALSKKGADPAVWVLNKAGDGVELRPVQVAAFAGDRMLVAGGVKDGDRVVTAGVQKLDAGVKVRVWTEPVR